MIITALYPFLSLGLFFTNLISPQFGMILSLFSPLFLILYFESEDRKEIITAFFVIATALAAFWEPVVTGYYILACTVPVAMLVMNHKSANPSRYAPVVFSPLPLTVMVIGMLSFMPETREAITANIASLLKEMTAPVAAKPELLDEVSYVKYLHANSRQVAEWAVLLLPALNYVSVALMTYITEKIYARQDLKVAAPFRMPDTFVWPVILAGFMLAFNVDQLYFPMLNVLIIFCVLYFFQGLDIIIGFFERIRLSRFIRFFLYIFVFSEPPFIVAISLVGLFSIWMKPWKKKTEEQK